MTVHETDVLVVGGGLAALRAALSAREAGARVLVAVKRKLGQSGSSANTSGGFAAACADLVVSRIRPRVRAAAECEQSEGERTRRSEAIHGRRGPFTGFESKAAFSKR